MSLCIRLISDSCRSSGRKYFWKFNPLALWQRYISSNGTSSKRTFKLYYLGHFKNRLGNRDPPSKSVSANDVSVWQQFAHNARARRQKHKISTPLSLVNVYRCQIKLALSVKPQRWYAWIKQCETWNCFEAGINTTQSDYFKSTLGLPWVHIIIGLDPLIANKNYSIQLV